VRADDAARALATLLEARVEVLVRRVSASSAPFDGGVAVVLAPPDDAKLARGVVVEVEGALAVALIALAVKRPATRIGESARDAAPAIAGAFAAIVAAVARRVHTVAPLRVLAAGPSAPIARDVANLDADRIALDLTVVVDDDAHLARISVARSLAVVAPLAPWNARALAALGDAPLELAVVACATTAAASEVAALDRGDAWMPGVWPLARAGDSWSGPVALAAADGDSGIAADLGADGRLVLRGEVTPLEGSGETMDDSKNAALTDTLGDVPVVVRVEIGAASMRAREWAALSRGDVIALGRRIAEPVVLRVGGVAVARGELVEIDGEVGVRIVERLDAKETTQ
jgi:flagellar motor switch/type III secretory pathway protein FliN